MLKENAAGCWNVALEAGLRQRDVIVQGRTGFDNEKYLAEQSEEILKRIGQFGDKLFLEFGGKLLYDYHAARVLPGYDPNVKIRLLQKMKEKVGIILCIYAGDVAGFRKLGLNLTCDPDFSTRNLFLR